MSRTSAAPKSLGTKTITMTRTAKPSAYVILRNYTPTASNG